MSRFTALKMSTGLLISVWVNLSFVLQVLIILMVLDFVTGILVAVQQQNLSSQKSYQGISKKVIVLVLITATAIIEQYLNIDIPLVEVVAGFYIANEFISILENVAVAGVPVPGVLRDTLQRLNEMAKR
ncbi:MAG: phage holin family protein [Caldilineaceae bacterium]|nr:phage holin family protein [Caldilineaceae bacterium]